MSSGVGDVFRRPLEKVVYGITGGFLCTEGEALFEAVVYLFNNRWFKGVVRAYSGRIEGVKRCVRCIYGRIYMYNGCTKVYVRL